MWDKYFLKPRKHITVSILKYFALINDKMEFIQKNLGVFQWSLSFLDKILNCYNGKTKKILHQKGEVVGNKLLLQT